MFTEPKNVWRIHLKPKEVDNSMYCIDNSIVAIGWGFFKMEEEGEDSNSKITYEDVRNIESWEDYKLCHGKYYYDGQDKLDPNVENFHDNIIAGDVIWMHAEDGNYYFAQVKEESTWRFCSGHEAREKNASNQRINIHWHKVEDWNSIPTELRNKFKVRKPPLLEVTDSAVVKEFTLEQLRRLEK